MIGFWLLVSSTLAVAGPLTVGQDAPTLQAAIDRAAPGDVVLVSEGEWAGPIVVDKAVTLQGVGGVILGPESGDTVRVLAPGVRLVDLDLRGSGDSMDDEDACIWVGPDARGATLQGNRLRGCLFGIWIHTTPDVEILDNDIVGRPATRDADKGNGIHLFDATGLTVRGNVVRGARDGIYVSATEHSLIEGNTVSGQRYGIHYMYSYDNRLIGNHANDNNGGIALMQSRRLEVAHNVATGNTKQGILFRDAQYCNIHHNRMTANGEGLFFFSSTDNEIHHNTVRGNQHGFRVWAGSYDNQVWANDFIANRVPVFYVSAYDQTWGTEAEGGNYWSDHLAWDQDADGFADRPYRADTTTAMLLHRWPAAVLLLNSPAMELLRGVQERLPALRVPSVIDPRPRMAPSNAVAP